HGARLLRVRAASLMPNRYTTPMRNTLFALGILLAGYRLSQAQLLPVNDTGMTMGHVLVNVTSVDAHKKFWIESFDAKPIKVGTLEGVTIPGLVLLFRPQPMTGPGEGEIINHLGLKLNKLSDFTARF